jgi:hypothetical protein
VKDTVLLLQQLEAARKRIRDLEKELIHIRARIEIPEEIDLFKNPPKPEPKKPRKPRTKAK